ncbi:MAG: hypothetical protein FWG10_09465, partial [Eubacteriaceae bacterium]|nr:hypothetical protein [Eubacteriaceae bacterium]
PETRQFRHRRALRCFRRLPAATPEPTAFQAVVVQLKKPHCHSNSRIEYFAMKKHLVDKQGISKIELLVIFIPNPNLVTGI